MYKWVELNPSGSFKKNDVHYLNSSISRAVFPKWDFKLGLFLLSESVPRHNGLRRCFVYLVSRK